MAKSKIIGPIDVSTGKITPITHQPIPQVTTGDWGNLPATLLIDQLSTLQSRKNALMAMGKDTAALQMQYGIDRLQKAIETRLRFDENLMKSKNPYYNKMGQPDDNK